MFRFLIFDEVNLYIVSMITFYGLVRFTFTLNLKNKIAPRLHTPMLLVFFFFFENRIHRGAFSYHPSLGYSRYCFSADVSRLMTLMNVYTYCIVLVCYKEEEL